MVLSWRGSLRLLGCGVGSREPTGVVWWLLLGLAYMTAQVTNAVVEGSLDVRQAGRGSVVGDATLYWLG